MFGQEEGTRVGEGVVQLEESAVLARGRVTPENYAGVATGGEEESAGESQDSFETGGFGEMVLLLVSDLLGV